MHSQNARRRAEEWSRGAVIGWAAALAAVVPMVIGGALHPQFSWAAPAWEGAVVSVISLCVGALASEVAFRGFLFQQADRCHRTDHSDDSAVVDLCADREPGAEWDEPQLRGDHHRRRAVLDGVPANACALARLGDALRVGGGDGGCVRAAGSRAWRATPAWCRRTPAGPLWLTGGVYGPDGALFTAIVFFVAMAVVYRVTRNYAWSYTHPEIVPGGYPMDVPPPPAHTAMEEAAAAKTATLVQIAPAPSSNGLERSSSPESAHRP